eukprot:GHUV01021698.1.p2 GENE.GHUV01021698.1~~GHUV01021698.1.p2  ORF type:complete len:198 (+),score=16.56 GHUV01021698.1:477-1070(+)
MMNKPSNVPRVRVSFRALPNPPLRCRLQICCVQRKYSAAALRNWACRSPVTAVSMHCALHTYTDISAAARRALPVVRKAVKASVALTVVSCMSTPTANAAPTKRKPHRVQQVLDYLKQRPMTVTSQPMQYDAEPCTTLPECIRGLTAEDVVTDKAAAESHMARVIAGLLYTACGGLDQAHNLVTPLCWGSWTPYGGV